MSSPKIMYSSYFQYYYRYGSLSRADNRVPSAWLALKSRDTVKLKTHLIGYSSSPSQERLTPTTLSRFDVN